MQQYANMHSVMSLRERGKQRRLERTLEAARAILAEEGGEGLQMRAIAERAELSVRTVYNQFGSKSDVLEALVSRMLSELQEELERLAIDDGIDRSRAIITVSIARFHRERDVLRPLFAASQPGMDHPSGGRVTEQARRLQQHAIEDAVAARQLSDLAVPRQLGHQVLMAYNTAASAWAIGRFGHREFETHALHAWACLLLGFARGATRARLVAELEALEKPMERILGTGETRRSVGAAR